MKSMSNSRTSSSTLATLGSSLLCLAISACGAGAGDIDCSSGTQKQWAYNAMQDYYLFYDQVPVVDPLSFSTTDTVVKGVRFEERDPYSNVSSAATSSLLFDEGRGFGLGFGVLNDNDGQPRIVLSYADSPFGQAGIERGDIVLTVDGFDWGDDELDTNWSERVVGTPQNPATSTWTFEKNITGQEISVTVTAAEYDINSVLAYDTYTIGSLPNKVGYLAFNTFLNTSVDELDEAFTQFENDNIGELILDLRYNGGGRIFVARVLASLIGNSNLASQPLYEYQYNDKYQAANYPFSFSSVGGPLNLNRVVVLTTQRTASASEIVIAGLQPYMEVVTIGSATSGKPYISSPNDRCGERLNIMEAEGVNANGVSVFGGIQATCFAEDDPSGNFGVNAQGEFEGFLNAGINYLQDSSQCAAPPANPQADQRQRASDEILMRRRTDTIDWLNTTPMAEITE